MREREVTQKNDDNINFELAKLEKLMEDNDAMEDQLIKEMNDFESVHNEREAETSIKILSTEEDKHVRDQYQARYPEFS